MILVTGGHGQLGRALASSGGDFVCAVGSEVDIRERARVESCLSTVAPAAVINCAAYTKVDLAEINSKSAYAVNCDGAGVLARACRARNIPLIHVSTDYVFDGTATQPHQEDDRIAPINVYGASKAAGERVVHDAGGIVVRTSWLFGDGGPNFIHIVLRLARLCAPMCIVADQHGCPTYAGDLAEALIVLARRALAGEALAPTYHFCGEGATTWHGFATAIVDELRRIEPIACERIEAITTAEYPTAARRPAYSVLDTSRIAAIGIVPPPWHDGMRRVVADNTKAGA
jgi:dTDP-4-dehydrorhamnose reductase